MITEKELKSGAILEVTTLKLTKSMHWSEEMEEFVIMWVRMEPNCDEGYTQTKKFKLAKEVFKGIRKLED